MKILICGAGRIGKSFIKYFSSEDNEIFLIDRSQRVMDGINKSYAVQSCVGDASSPSVLLSFHVRSFDLVLAVVHDQNANLVICKASSVLFPTAKRVVRVTSDDAAESCDVYKHMGVDVRFFPERQIAEFLYNKVLHFTPFYDDKFRLIVDKNEHPNATQLGVVKDGELSLTTQQLANWDYLISIAKNDAKVMHKGHVVIVGGGKVGVMLAKMLLGFDFRISIVEHNHEVAQALVLELPGVNIICGSPVDKDILLESGLGSNTTIVSVTDSDQVNLIVLLIANSIGCKNFFGTNSIHNSYINLAPESLYGSMYKTADIITGAVANYRKDSCVESLQVVGGCEIFSIDIVSEDILRFVIQNDFTRVAVIRNMSVLVDKRIKLLLGDLLLVLAESNDFVDLKFK